MWDLGRLLSPHFTEELKMHRVAAKFVPRLMTSDEEAHRVQVCQDLLDH